jgi:hypothetical protein
VRRERAGVRYRACRKVPRNRQHQRNRSMARTILLAGLATCTLCGDGLVVETKGNVMPTNEADAKRIFSASGTCRHWTIRRMDRYRLAAEACVFCLLDSSFRVAVSAIRGRSGSADPNRIISQARNLCSGPWLSHVTSTRHLRGRVPRLHRKSRAKRD